MPTPAEDRAARGYALEHDEGEAFWLLGMLETVKIGRADVRQEGVVELVEQGLRC